jgi:ABC-type phosphate transport system substrate-binding protein
MRRIAVAGMVGVVALGLVGCGNLTIERTGSAAARETAAERAASAEQQRP